MASGTWEKEVTLLLIGRTGDGKTATGNTILGKRMFAESSTRTPVTKDVVSNVTHFDNFLVTVLDTPGLMDSAEDKTTVVSNMIKAFKMCNGRVDAFILVIKHKRFTIEIKESVEVLKKVFGDNCFQKLIVVVTHGDIFKDDMKHQGRGDISYKEWWSLEGGASKKLFDDISDRFLLINNREKDPQRNETQRREIIQLADSFQKFNVRYPGKTAEEAKAARDKLIAEDISPMLVESLERRIGLLSGDILMLKIAPSAIEWARIRQSLDDIMLEIRETDKGTGLLNYLMVSVGLVNICLHEVH